MILCIRKRGGVDLEREMVGLKDEFKRDNTFLRTDKVGPSDMNLQIGELKNWKMAK